MPWDTKLSTSQSSCMTSCAKKARYHLMENEGIFRWRVLLSLRSVQGLPSSDAPGALSTLGLWLLETGLQRWGGVWGWYFVGDLLKNILEQIHGVLLKGVIGERRFGSNIIKTLDTTKLGGSSLGRWQTWSCSRRWLSLVYRAKYQGVK